MRTPLGRLALAFAAGTGRRASVGRFIAQSFASLRNAREGGPVKTEDDPLDPAPLPTRETSAAMRYLDQAVTDAGGIALRYGGFYCAPNDGLFEPVRKRQFPLVGDGGGLWSFIHLDDAAAATVLALEHDGPAIYNIVDDEPVAVRGCRRSHICSAPGRPAIFPCGSRGSWPAKAWPRWGQTLAVLRTRKPNAS